MFNKEARSNWELFHMFISSDTVFYNVLRDLQKETTSCRQTCMDKEVQDSIICKGKRLEATCVSS